MTRVHHSDQPPWVEIHTQVVINSNNMIQSHDYNQNLALGATFWHNKTTKNCDSLHNQGSLDVTTRVISQQHTTNLDNTTGERCGIRIDGMLWQLRCHNRYDVMTDNTSCQIWNHDIYDAKSPIFCWYLLRFGNLWCQSTVRSYHSTSQYQTVSSPTHPECGLTSLHHTATNYSLCNTFSGLCNTKQSQACNWAAPRWGWI